MARITRVLALYNRLKEGSCTVGQLAEQETDSTTSTRQIYRDLKDVAQFARTQDQRVLVFQIDQITYRTGKSFQRTKKLVNRVENDLANRFGITQNLDDEPYTIRLQFSGITGKFVGEQNWHHSQKIDEVQGPDGKLNYVLTLRCGINRELVGWIFQWMSNVRVLEPPQLVELYEQQLAMMRDSIKDPAHVTLAYTNIFEPKPIDG